MALRAINCAKDSGSAYFPSAILMAISQWRAGSGKDFGLFDGCSGGYAESFVIEQKPKKRLGVEQ